MRVVVSRPSVLVCDHGDAMRRLATSSPGTNLSFSPDVSSVLNISDKAVPSHSSLSRPDTLWKPRTATDFLTSTAVGTSPGVFDGAFERYRNTRHPRPASRRTTKAAP